VKDVPKHSLTDPEEIAKNSKIHDIKKVEEGELPNFKPTKKPMKRILKRAGSLIAGVIGFGGSLGAGLDINSAILIGATAAVAIISGEIAFAKEFKELFEDE